MQEQQRVCALFQINQQRRRQAATAIQFQSEELINIARRSVNLLASAHISARALFALEHAA